MPMPDPREDLRSTEDAIHHDAERINHLEEEKAGLDPADPRVVDLSHQVESLAIALRGKGAAERALSEEIQGTES
ncbi:MAG TPA: hypothetical protein VNF73_14970 [Candidatus Saccharimonadales bacterium]|nr:hypothetical protein [Candidatus Saccharimonadales bacterium]